MKKNTNFRKTYFVKIFSVFLLCAVLGSCKKKNEEEIKPVTTDVKVSVSPVSNESLIKFLSITLDVQKTEISFNAADDEFIVRGQLKFRRAEIENHYNESNVYQTIYGK